MILSRRVALDGVQLDEIDDAIVIQSVDPGTSQENVSAVDRMGYAGSRITGSHWQPLEAGVTFGINIPKRELETRREIFDAVKKWAASKGWLTMNEMPERRMYVDKVILPAAGDLWNWTNEFAIKFKAYNVPFWQDAEANQVQKTNVSTGSWQIEVGGDVKSVLDIDFKNTSGDTMTTFSISAGGNTISLTGISLANNGTLKIHHGTDGLLRILAGTTDVYEKYTGADDLYVEPGTVTVSLTAGKAGNLTIKNYGRYA